VFILYLLRETQETRRMLQGKSLIFTATLPPLSVSNPPMVDDRALVSRVLSGDMQAFRALIKMHERLVAHMVGRLVKLEEDREELCQDVFMKVYEKLGEFNFQSKLSTWIGTIAYRQAINHLRKRKIEITDFPPEISEIETDEVAEQDLEQYILKLIDGLPVQYKLVLTLFHLQQKNYAEIAEITGMPDGTVKNYLFRARQLLKEKAKKYLGSEEWT
jgi:RNA polymerase sigma factor (sigma-70 family)